MAPALPLEGPRGPCAPARVGTPAAGVAGAAYELRDSELAALEAKRELAAAASKKRWSELARTGNGDQARTPGSPSRSADIEHFLFHPGFPVDPRHNAKIDRRALQALLAG